MRRPGRPVRAAATAVATAMVIGSLASILAGGMHHLGPRAPFGAERYGGPTALLNPSAERFFGPTSPDAGPTKGIRCDRGSLPEAVQGKVPAADYESGRAADGYFCNARQVSQVGETGGYRVERYVDAAGHECAYWDSTLLWPHNVPNQGAEGPGTYVMDMSDPANPVHTDTLRTPAMQSPHESLRLNARRGLLVAVMGYPTWNPGVIDVYDVTQDCRHPVLQSSTPMGVIGHESGFAPDGNTLYVAGLYAHTLTAVDLTNPKVPVLLWATSDYQPHGVSISNDGNRLYMAEAAFQDDNGFTGLTILDVGEVQARVPNPTVRLVSRLTWPQVSTPQNATPFRIKGHQYLLETDEFGSGDRIGAARIIDIEDETKPFVVSNLRLAVNKGGETEDPGDSGPFQGYQGHYCSLPSRVDPQIVACSFIMSGLRVFDISNPKQPREIAYFNKPLIPGTTSTYPNKAGAFTMSAPAYD
ncbi:MAG: LVIVD repeat-containing protein, partial [Actinomycetota bacterium]